MATIVPELDPEPHCPFCGGTGYKRILDEAQQIDVTGRCECNNKEWWNKYMKEESETFRSQHFPPETHIAGLAADIHRRLNKFAKKVGLTNRSWEFIDVLTKAIKLYNKDIDRFDEIHDSAIMADADIDHIKMLAEAMADILAKKWGWPTSEEYWSNDAIKQQA